MKIPFIYTIKNFRSRKLTTAITIAGIALVVFVFAAVLMMAYGVQKTMQSTGSSENVMIVRKSANGEISSIIDGDTQGIIETLPYLAKSSDGGLISSREPVVVINLDKGNGGFTNVTVRGVSQNVSTLRPHVEIIDGEMFNPSLRELIVGEAIADRFPEARIGNLIRFSGNDWKVVGVFSSGGSGFDSEIWVDGIQMLDAFNRGNSVSTVTMRLDDPANFEQFKKTFEEDRRLQQFEPKIEQDFFGEQSEALSTFIRILGIFITIIFSAGAIVGAAITMYAAVANRTVEIGTLRALGFRRTSILIAFLVESLIISIIGGAIGIFLASFLQFFSISTLNFQSFTELAFNFALSPAIVIASMIFSVFMGFIGGFLPSVRASRLSIVNALRAG